MEDAAAGGGDGAVTTPPPAPTFPVCMEAWTCNGRHRICFIPCGHVYGRSCLERWLHRSCDDSAKSPQCGEQFDDKLIINLYAPGNLWDGCCRLQDLRAHYNSIVTEHVARAQSDIEKLRTDLIGLKERETAVGSNMRLITVSTLVVALYLFLLVWSSYFDVIVNNNMD